jgi:hypothetical protein
MRMTARVRATLANLVTRVLDKGHDQYCPCGALESEPVNETVPTRVVLPGNYDQNREATQEWERNTGPADRGAL